MFRALRWLIVNNMYYNDVMINNDTLEMLPIDRLKPINRQQHVPRVGKSTQEVFVQWY